MKGLNMNKYLSGTLIALILTAGSCSARVGHVRADDVRIRIPGLSVELGRQHDEWRRRDRRFNRYYEDLAICRQDLRRAEQYRGGRNHQNTIRELQRRCGGYEDSIRDYRYDRRR